MSSDPPPPYPGGPSAPLIEEKNGQPPASGTAPPSGAVPVTNAPTLQVHPIPPEHGPPPYETTLQPGFVPPHVPGEGPMPMPMPMPMPHPHAGYYPPPGYFPQPIPGQYPPGPSHYPSPGGHTATVIAPPGAATTVTVLQGEMFQSAPVQTVCPHCQQAIVTRISHDVGLMNTLFCLFCCFVGCDLGCCLIPCLIDDLKDVTHTCPNCKGYIYTYKRMC
ncbi:cell death-inducing p53-target protein 1 [Megalops cyprinoides]|uniref:cell death-inducing p53-target protein 1 n=1 Tax=Megalops cyprinoides TaxID=118141 RepID=UPI001864BBCD|nr:cell death-inducing p53-target protein 1 [Megalops cyprinoides]XP_036408538.1 cell death-inducing p53-target protein 1 [Megalops cyprinoides]